MGRTGFEFQIHVGVGTFFWRHFLYRCPGPRHCRDYFAPMSVMRLLPIYEPRVAWFGLRPLRTLPGLLVILLFGNLDAVFAHGGKPHTWHDLWHTWSSEPLVVIS